MGEERLWQVEDVAGYLDVPVSSVYKLTSRKSRIRIPHIHVNGRLRFRKVDIDGWLESMKKAGSNGKHNKTQMA
jgi:excisionase family DNA binding protein